MFGRWFGSWLGHWFGGDVEPSVELDFPTDPDFVARVQVGSRGSAVVSGQRVATASAGGLMAVVSGASRIGLAVRNNRRGAA
jgi:hypothetical protein